MAKHTEWRKLAKKLRRKRLRQRYAQERDDAEKEAQRKREASPTYQRWLMQQEQDEIFQAQEEVRLAAEREAQWLRIEEEAQKQWREMQKKLDQMREERQKQNARIKLEWEKEQKRLQDMKEQKEREAEAQRLYQEQLNEKTENFIANGGSTPEHLKVRLETNPGKQTCPFFKKTAACRFREVCSRNHVRPTASRILLIPNFYCHYSLVSTEKDFGSDTGLEFENKELYNDYKEFFYDVISELENYGRIVHFKVCCNHEAHLRGNVYVEYNQTREAVKCYRALNGRYYGGKQLSVQFCNIHNWRLAICGEFFRKTCPKGNLCNFLHVFINPDKMFPHNHMQERRFTDSDLDSIEERRNWRWSESPEREGHSERMLDEWERCDSENKTLKHSTKRYSSSSRKNGSSRRTSERSRDGSPRISRRRSRSSERRRRRRSKSRSRSSRKYSERSRKRTSERS